VAVLPLALAVTVIVRRDESPAVDNVAIAAPAVVVVAVVTATPPEVAENVTGMPAIKLFDASRTKAVMVAVVEPSDKMDGELAVRVTAETGTPPVVPVPVPVPVPVAGAPVPVMVWEPPPQAAKNVAAIQATIDSLRISFIPRSTSVGVRNQ
jgi:hypothetical protein